MKRFHYDNHDQLREHLENFISAYNFGRRLKTLKGLTPYEFICKCWTSQPERFTLNPIHHMPGLNRSRLILRPRENAELARQPREPIFGGVNTQTIAHQVLCFNKALDVEGWTPGS